MQTHLQKARRPIVRSAAATRLPNKVLSVAREAALHERYERRLFALLFVVSAALTLAVMFGGGDSPNLLIGALGGLAALGVVALIVWRPLVMFYFLAIAALVIEEEPLTTAHDLTDQLPIFNWPVSLAGQPERPIGYLLLLTFFILIARHFIQRDQLLHGGKLLWPFVAFLACVALGVVMSLATGGDFKITIVEIRPFWYLFVSYLLAYNVVTDKRHVRA